ncbi:ubiquitin c-terminal hydrolase [Xylariales sp. PMI_506]|nr:ubiquitin c-terminal hydrolase [Xylariales sp. PMI_506]
MDQDPIPDESRERAVSSEPSSTRPNPFDDGDLSARKRQRTSLNGSRSRSVESITARDIPEPVLSNDTMKVDTPEPAGPSTPPQSGSPAEPPSTGPHSSKVTINLRNPESAAASPSRIPSPSKVQRRADDIKDSVERGEVDMVRSPSAELAVEPSALEQAGPEVAVIALDEEEDDDLELVGINSSTGNLDLGLIMLEFPYHSAEETYSDTVMRLVQFFSQSTQFDEVFFQLQGWLDRYLQYARAGIYSTEAILESCLEHRSFWLSLPEMFWAAYLRRSYIVKNRSSREQAGPFFAQLARLTAHFFSLDARILHNLTLNDDATYLDLFSTTYMTFLANMTRRDEAQSYEGGTYAVDSIFDTSEVLDIFQTEAGGSMIKLARMIEAQLSLLTRFPKKTMDNFAGVCNIAASIVRDSQFHLSYNSGSTEEHISRARKNLATAVRLFRTVSTALDLVIDKSVNHLSSDTATHIINSLTKIIAGGLQGGSRDASKMIDEHREKYPTIHDSYTGDTIVYEWRFATLGKLIRSRQMQLRVVAVSILCNDLVSQWKRGPEFTDDAQHTEYLRHHARLLTTSGLINYIFGPTCHPEITQESSNIVGFLMVTRTYGPVQTDAFWQTMTTTQDPRIAEALARMMTKIIHLLTADQLPYLYGKLQSLSVDAFTPCMRELCDAILKSAQEKNALNSDSLFIIPFQLCLRLIQESSIYKPQGGISQPEIQSFAALKFRDLLQYHADADTRRELLASCMKDIAAKTTTTSGSLHALYIIIRHTLNRDLTLLVTEQDFVKLLTDELEATIAHAQAVGFVPVYASHIGVSRRELIMHTVINHGEMIDTEHGQRLWDLLVGEGAACQEDRKVAWQQLNVAAKRTRFNNPFLITCLHQHLPKLDPKFYCEGALGLVHEALAPLTNDATGTILDEEGSVENAPIELLWQMILTAPNQTIESQAIHILVNNVYVESKTIVSFPLHRARKVHFGLVHRCLQQLAAAAKVLQSSSSDKGASEITNEAIDSPGNNEKKEQELKFVRSLTVLRIFLKTLQGKQHFSAPDLRSLMLQSPSAIEGESAELKFQSFDGNQQTDVRPLSIGRQNTAASLLASIREVTGFDNYRIFYRGVPLTPTEDQICKSLEDLQIHNGLLLVKRESDAVSSPVKVKPGASPLEIEILGHFKELWEYLSMDEKLAREIYGFLVKLPADGSILATFDDSSASYRDVFPLGEPFKCLYTIHALREYLSTRRLKSQALQANAQNSDGQQKTAIDQEEALLKALHLLTSAICDPDVVGRCPSEALQILLSFELVDNMLQLLKESTRSQAVLQFLSPKLQERLLAILASAATAPSSQGVLELIYRSLEALLECCSRSSEFWENISHQPAGVNILQKLLLKDERPFVRKNVTKLISSYLLFNHADAATNGIQFAEMFWPIVFELLPHAVREPAKCEDVFSLSFILMKRLADANSPALDLQVCLLQCAELLISHTTTENISRPDRVDGISHGLALILFHGIKFLSSRDERIQFPPSFSRRLFHKHLFPPEDAEGPLNPQVAVTPSTRAMLIDIILALSRGEPRQYQALLRDLDDLTPYSLDDPRNPYKYDLPQSYDRTLAVRSSSGYPGLRNLSNTCYLNSLLTQLFMNHGFRRFILETPILNTDKYQLLSETQELFAGLQDSVRRFIDPQQFVSQITTYDESPIDIHNQMDVDEFYNLLFDRWEAQMPHDQAKKALRSIYGGQLVQQVKSKECEHISERMEPFSAIQCDIKGIASLQESLQAYVDGEIMEGDNKYKCETCDRHVDAVKRACLKDVPDNLIFHLKRFGFNLRTLQRSKINDHFTFPTKIDMQPYTVEHLSDPSRKTDPDIFELVGVLVHSGTAESGHYYSYIRERPSTTDKESWVEFNDDSVTAWDPVHMEAACFGGTEYNTRFDSGGMFEKVYSAYMLFYQRSTSLRADQESLKLSGDHGDYSCPIRVDLPADLELQIKGENWGIVQRYCLNDAAHIPFVLKVLANVWDSTCSDNHRIENLAMHVALGHLDQVVSRVKDVPDFPQINQALIHACESCARCSYCFFEYFKDRPEALRMLLQKNTDPVIRSHTSRRLISALMKIRKHFPEVYNVPEEEDPDDDEDVEDDNEDPERRGDVSVTYPCALTNAIHLFKVLWETFHSTLRAWPEYFGTMADFSMLGKAEAAAFLEENFLAKLIMIITADSSRDLTTQYSRMVSNISRRMPNRPPNYDSILDMLETLLSVMKPDMDGQPFAETPRGRLQMALRDEAIPYTADEINLIHRDWGRGGQSNIFVDKLIQLNQNYTSTDAILRILMDFSPLMDDKICITLQGGITGQLAAHFVAPYLRAAATYVEIGTNPANVEQLIIHICNQCKTLSNVEGMSFLDFFREIFDNVRPEDDPHDALINNLRILSRWVPGLLGCMDRNVSHSVEDFLEDVLWQWGPTPVFEDSDGGVERSQATVIAAKDLALACLMYLQETYISRGAQAPRDNVAPLERTIRRCAAYFSNEGPAGSGNMDRQYAELFAGKIRSLHIFFLDLQCF